ncbi:hypothetical protein AAY473_026789 [Plecturocebus cupreus]
MPASLRLREKGRMAREVETRFHHVGQADLKLRISGDPPALVSQSTEMTGVSHSAVGFYSLMGTIVPTSWSSCEDEVGFHHIGQAGLELLTSGDPPASASESAGITGVSHRTRSKYKKSSEAFFTGLLDSVAHSSSEPARRFVHTSTITACTTPYCKDVCVCGCLLHGP